MKEKVEAIFDLREAAEEHARAEVELERRDSREHRDALLEARMRLEESTHDAIEACEHCGLPHAPAGSCGQVVPFPARPGEQAEGSI